MKKIVLLLVSSLILFACNEDEFLDKRPHTPSDDVYTTQSGALMGIAAAYNQLRLGETVERCEMAGTVCSGDAMTGGEPGGRDQNMLQMLMKFVATPDNAYPESFWNELYRGIYRCNLVLSYINEPLDGWDKPELQDQIKGEALFLRALFHFKLQVYFGGMPQCQDDFGNKLMGVPYIDKVLSSDEWTPTRPELNYTWQKIEEDFLAAEALLPLRSELLAGSGELGRATKGAAQAMLAKTYLYQEKWEQAYNYAKTVIDSKEYYLEGETGHNDPYIITRLAKEGEVSVQVSGYKWIWQPESNNCPESIFDNQHRQNGTGIGYPNNQEGNLMPRYYGPRNVHVMTRVRNTNPIQFVEDSAEYFWGFILPTHYFIETAFKDIGCEEGDEIKDPRFKITVVGPNDSVPWYYADATVRALQPDSVKVNWLRNLPSTPWVTMKYFTDPYYNNIRGGLGDMPQNTKYFRFADLLLMGAEAGLHTGHDAEALEWINRVRDRARNSYGFNTGYPKALTAVTLADVYAERRVELAFEGHQFWDLVRTKRADDVLGYAAANFKAYRNIRGEVTEQFGDAFISGKHEVWPIPMDEIANTNGSITQNPNY